MTGVGGTGEEGEPSASGGGVSIFFARPSWQSGLGIPLANSRHVPDVALTASGIQNGYLVFIGGEQDVYGGTSVPTPAFAALAVLLNQHLVLSGIQSAAGLGNINPKLYSLAQTAPSVFYDITSGDKHCDG